MENNNSREEYFNSLNFNMETMADIIALFKEFEEKRLSKEDYMYCLFMTYAKERSKSYEEGWKAMERRKKQV